MFKTLANAVGFFRRNNPRRRRMISADRWSKVVLGEGEINFIDPRNGNPVRLPY